MLKLVRLFGTMFSLSLKRQIAFRGDFAFEVALTVVGLGSSLVAIAMLYSQTGTLAGWTLGQSIALLGTFQIITGLRAAFVEPSLTWLGDQVIDGRFDAILIQPAPAIYLASFSSCAPLALTQVGAGAGVVVYGIHLSALSVSAAEIIAWVVLLLTATVLMWSTRALVAAAVFFAIGLSLDVVYDAVWQFARYPVDIYRRPIRLLLTYVLPVAFLATVPARVLVHGARFAVVPTSLAVGIGSVVLAHLAWRAGLRRYTSATS